MTVSGARTHRVVRLAVRVLAVITAVLLVLYAVMWAVQRKLVFQPDSSPVPPAQEVVPGAQDVIVHTSDGLDLGAWLIPADPESDRDLVVLFAAGNGGNRAGRADFGALLAARGFTVLMLDYRGYGGNPGSPSEEGLAKDAVAAAEFLTSHGYALDKTIYFGESLGCAVVTRLQSTHPPAAMVLRSPFTSMTDVASDMLPWVPISLLLRDTFEVTPYVADSTIPMSVVWGGDDTLVAPELSQTVAATAPNLVETLVVPGADHNDVALVGDDVADVVVRIADVLG